MGWLSYSDVMGEVDSFLTITLDLAEPVEIHDFAAFFAGLGSQFDDYLAKHHPDLKGTARLYVREVRHGSTIADLVPQLSNVIGTMDSVLIVAGFAALFSQRVRAWIHGRHVPEATKSDIGHMSQTIRAVAHDKEGRLRVDRITYENGLFKKKLEVAFNTTEARQAVRTLESQRFQIEAERKEGVDHQRVLMRFTRPDYQDAKIGKRSGEQVVISEISEKPLALIYGSDLVEERLKDETRDPESIFYKGFVVDVNVQRPGGRNVAYVVTHVHQVIELPKPDEAE